MKKHFEDKRLVYIIVLLLFVGAPFLYYNMAPDSFFFEPIVYYAEDVSLSEPFQTITADRIIHSSFKGEWVDELFLVCVDCSNTRVIEITGTSTYDSLKENPIKYVHDLSEYGLKPGTYKWYFAIKGAFPYNTVRTFTFESNEFEVTK